MVLCLGYVGMKKTKTVNDFFLGDRAIGPWVTAFAYGTSYFSAVLFIGYAAQMVQKFYSIKSEKDMVVTDDVG